MSQQSSHSVEPVERGSGEDALIATAKGLQHQFLIFGLGVILAISTTCQILRVDFTLYLWIVFAVYIVCSVVWVITRRTSEPRLQASEPQMKRSSSHSHVDLTRVKRARNLGNAEGPDSSTDVNARDSEDIENIGNVNTKDGRQA